MGNRPKQIGTAAETAVRRALLARGYSELDAHRNVLKGSADEGDVWLRHPHGLIVFEVKGGKTAKTASHNQCLNWLDEAHAEARNASARFGVLVTQRAGVGYPRAGEWWLYAHSSTINDIGGATLYPSVFRLTLNEFLDQIHAP